MFIISNLGVNAGISETAEEKRSAVIKLSTSKVHSFGVFISEDGHALVHLQALATKEKPVVSLSDGTSLGMGRILGVLDAQELALVKLNHSPKSWLTLSSAEPELDEVIALVPLDNEKPWSKTAPPIVGPIMAKRSTMTANLKDLQFVKVMSLGSLLLAEQRLALGPGRFAVNGGGELVAFTAGTVQAGPQTLILVSPIAGFVEEIGDLKGSGEEMRFPLSDENNPIDPASLDSDFHLMKLAKSRSDWVQFERLILGLHERFPESPLIKADLAVLTTPRLQGRSTQGFDVEAFLKTLATDSDQTKAEQVSVLSTKSEILWSQGKLDAAIEVIREAIEISPADYPKCRYNLAVILVMKGNFAEAEKVARELNEDNSDSFDIVQVLGVSVVRQGKPDKNPDTRQRLKELDRIFGLR